MGRSAFAASILLLTISSQAKAEAPLTGACPQNDNRGPLGELIDTLHNIFHKTPVPDADESRPLPDDVDTIVIGAGPGGGTVAAGMAAAGKTVALIDAGDLGPPVPIEQSLAAFADAAEDPARSTAYQVQRDADNPVLSNYPRVSAAGGASAGAAGIITPFSWDSMDQLAKYTGDSTLSAASMLPHQKAVEDALYDPLGKAEGAVGISTLHGHDGFQDASLPGLPTLLSSAPDIKQIGGYYKALLGDDARNLAPTAILSRVLKAGDVTNPKVQDSEGLVVLPAAVNQDGKRATVAELFATTQAAHPNLYLKGNSVVNRILFTKGPDGKLVPSGVEYIEQPQGLAAQASHDPNAPKPVTRIVHAKHVIIAANPMGTVGILERSGIGPTADEKRLGVTPLLNLPGVGQGLGDRLETTITMKFPQPFKITSQLKAVDDKLAELSARIAKNPNDTEAQAEVTKLFADNKGILDTNGIPAAMLWKSDPSLDKPDLLFIGFPGDFTNFRKGFSKDFTSQVNDFSIIMLKINTASNGNVKVTSTDPGASPQVNVNYDVNGPDFQAMAKGVLRFNQEIAAKIPGVTVVQGKADTLQQAQDFLKDPNNVFGHHIRGGADMGPASNPMAVVDSHAQVYGTDGLYVAGTAMWPFSLGPFPILPIEAMSNKLTGDMLSAEKAGH